MLSEAGYYSRMALGVYRFLKAPPIADPEQLIRWRIRNRETSFLETARKVIFSNPANPYSEMFRLAGCAWEDLAACVHRDGLEGALAALQCNGIWLDHEEFKGAKPIVRSGRRIPSNKSSFANPLRTGLLDASSSGSRSGGTRTRRSLEHLLYREAQEALRWREFSLSGRTHLEVQPILPSTTGLNPCLRSARRKYPVERWFSPGGSWRDSSAYRALSCSLVILSRAMGVWVPFSTRLPTNDFTPAAEWLARRKDKGNACVVGSNVSVAVRIVTAAADRGLDLSGTLFLLNGEPLSEAKGSVLRQAGCAGVSQYGISELGNVGAGCRHMTNRSCTHLFRDSVAAIGYRRTAPLTDVEVDSVLLTTLTPFAPNILINVEMQDCGALEKAQCDCVYSEAGLDEQIRDIYSFGKLSGFGVTLVGTDLVRVLEVALPRRLGGAPGDYQLVEREGKSSQTQLTLRISPRVKLASKQRAAECFLSELRGVYGGSLAARSWAHAEAIEVVVDEPLATPGGKVLLLHLLRKGGADGRRKSAHAS